MSHSPDEDRDAHLLAALRHAPDRDVKPPADVSAAILGRAQAAVQPVRSRSSNERAGWRAAIDRILRPAPMAAFGTVAMATLIGVMWSGQSPPDATPSLRSEVSAAAPPPVAPAAPAAAEESLAAPLPAIQQAPARAPTARTSPRAAPLQPPADAQQSKRAAIADVAVAEGSPTNSEAAETAQQTAPTPPPAETRERESLRGAAAKPMADAAPAAPATLALPARRSRAESTAATLGAAAPAAAAPLTAPTVELEAAVRSDLARVRWQVAGGRMAAHGPAQRDWWAAVARATQGRWQAAGASEPAGAQITLTIDGSARGSLAFEPNHLLWREPGGMTWRAPVAADTLREWQEALARW